MDAAASTLEEGADELYEHAPCGYLSMLPDGTIIKLNETLASWLRYPREQILGRQFQELLTVPGRIFHDTHYMPLLGMQGFVHEIAFDMRRAAGPPLPVLLSTVARRDSAGRIVMYRTALFECSHRRAYERELLSERRRAEQASMAKAALLAMMSHDMRSPLGSIIMAADLLEDSDPEAQRRYIRIVKSAAGSVLDLVDAILEHSKLDSGMAAWQLDDVDLRALVAEITAIMSVKADAKGITLKTQIDPQIPREVRADGFKLGQILSNLLSNAIKFTDRGGVRLDVSVLSMRDDTVKIELRVTDTGIGIPADRLVTIFDEFQQGTDTTKRVYGGHGLGLAISRKLAALAGGTLHVASRPGEGSAFWCVLRMPIAETESP